MGFGALLFLLLVILASVAIVGVILRSSRARAAAERSGELTLFDLSVGDIVQHTCSKQLAKQDEEALLHKHILKVNLSPNSSKCQRDKRIALNLGMICCFVYQNWACGQCQCWRRITSTKYTVVWPCAFTFRPFDDSLSCLILHCMYTARLK